MKEKLLKEIEREGFPVDCVYDIIDEYIFFKSGYRNYSATITKTGKLKKNSIRID